MLREGVLSVEAPNETDASVSMVLLLGHTTT